VLALENFFSPDAAATLRTIIEVRFPGGTFRVTVHDGTIDITRGAADDPTTVIETDPTALEELAFGMRSIEDAEGPALSGCTATVRPHHVLSDALRTSADRGSGSR